MKKFATFFTLVATALTLTACSNNNSNTSSKDSGHKTEKTQKSSKKKSTKDNSSNKSKKLTMNVKKSDVVGQVYVGCDTDNKSKFIEFFVGKDHKRTRMSTMDNTGKVEKGTIWNEAHLVIEKDHPRTFIIKGDRTVWQQDYEGSIWKFTKVKPDTIQDLAGKKFKLYQGKRTTKALRAYILKNAYGSSKPKKAETKTSTKTNAVNNEVDNQTSKNNK